MSTATVPGVPIKPLAEDFEEIFQQHYRLIYCTAFQLTRSAEDAEDILQTIFLRLLRRDQPPDLDRNPKAYLYRAAVNLSLDTIRARKRQLLTAEADCAAIPASDPAAENALYTRLYEAMAELKPKAAEILVLRYVHNYSDAEIARLLGTSRGTIAVSLFRAKAQLKKIIRASLGAKS